MTHAPPARAPTYNDTEVRRSVLVVATSNPAANPRHWHYINLGQGVHATDPGLAQYLEDEFVLGERVAEGFEEDALWGADGIITLMGAPGAPWEGK